MRSFLLILILAFSITGCQQINSKQSVAINDSVIVHQKKLMASLETFVQALESKKCLPLKMVEALQKSANDGITAVKAMESPNCDDQFLPASIELFDYYQKAAETEYKTIGYLYGIDSISYEQYDSLQVLIEDFKANQKSVNDRFLKAQRLFADNCDFKLVKHED
ncbi:MAG: hypothetical protein R2728_00595 [Chitinophagales bacterium]